MTCFELWGEGFLNLKLEAGNMKLNFNKFVKSPKTVTPVEIGAGMTTSSLFRLFMRPSILI
jgi:hypothetical protein